MTRVILIIACMRRSEVLAYAMCFWTVLVIAFVWVGK